MRNALSKDDVKDGSSLLRKNTHYKLCKIAVSQNGLALEKCPKDKIVHKLCEIAVLQNPNAIEFCPRKFTDDKQDLISLAINKKPSVIHYIDKSHKYYTKLEHDAKDIALKLGVEYYIPVLQSRSTDDERHVKTGRRLDNINDDYFKEDICSKHRIVKDGQVTRDFYYYCTKDSCKRTRDEIDNHIGNRFVKWFRKPQQ
jgi:hypothetical protein